MLPYIILGVIVIFIVITVIRAAFYVPKKKNFSKLPEEKVDANK